MKFFGIPYNLRQLQYLLGDLLMMVVAIQIGQALRYGLGVGHDFAGVIPRHIGASLVFASSTVLMLYLSDAYNSTLDFRRRFDIFRLWTAVALALPLHFLAFSVFPHGWWGRELALLSGLALVPLITVWRATISTLNPRPPFRIRTLIVGAGRAGHLLAAIIANHPRSDRIYDLVGFLDSPPAGTRRLGDHLDDDPVQSSLDGPRVLGGVADLKDVVVEHGVELIIVALRGGISAELTRSLLDCKARGVLIEDMPTVYKHLTGKVPILHLPETWLIFGPVFAGTSRLGSAAQRLVDVLIALFGLACSAPILLVTGVMVRLESRGPAFFMQERLGQNERPFKIIKLRTMCNDAEAKSGAVWSKGSADPRVTRVGKFLRRSRIDELPQFYNVLRGDMSLVGPRPEREHFVTQLKEHIPFYGLRFSVKPGVTGWAQVKYRYGATEDDAAEKLCYELYAIQEMSPLLYLVILVKTVQTVLLRPGS